MQSEHQNQLPIIESMPGAIPEDATRVAQQRLGTVPDAEGWSKPTLYGEGIISQAPAGVVALGNAGLAGEGLPGPQFEEPARPFNRHSSNPDINKRTKITVVRDV